MSYMGRPLSDSEPDRDEGQAQDEAVQRARRIAQQRPGQPLGAVRGRKIQEGPTGFYTGNGRKYAICCLRDGYTVKLERDLSNSL